MSSEAAFYPKDHNMPPIVLPKDEEMLAEMRRKYPEIEKEIPELEAAFAGYPTELTLKDADVAKGLTDLVDQAKKTRRVWKSHAAGEKGPLNKLVKIVGNFFTSADEKVGALLEKYEPVVEAYIQKVNDQKERERQEEIRRQQEKEAQARAAAEAAQREAEERQRAAEESRRKEAEARAAAERAARERAEAEARAEAAKAEEKRLADAKRERERAEKDAIVVRLRETKQMLKTAERYHSLCEAEEADQDEIGALDDLIRYGGTINKLMAPLLSSTLLDDDQSDNVRGCNTHLAELRNAQNARLNKREQARREKARKEAEARDAKLAEERRLQREKDDAEYAAAKKRREDEDAKAAAAAEEKRRQDAAARESREAARGHERDAKTAGKDAIKAGDDADRAANRADRLDSRGEARSQVRADLGAVGTLARNWKHFVDDEAAIRATMGPLGQHIALDAIEAAAYFYMRAHQAGFQGERVLPKELPGVRFSLVEDLRT